MFIINLYLLITYWVLSSLPVAFLHNTLFRFGQLDISILGGMVFITILVMIMSLPGTFRKIALVLMLLWVLPYYGFSLPTSVSASFMVGGFSLFNSIRG